MGTVRDMWYLIWSLNYHIESAFLINTLSFFLFIFFLVNLNVFLSLCASFQAVINDLERIRPEVWRYMGWHFQFCATAAIWSLCWNHTGRKWHHTMAGDAGHEHHVQSAGNHHQYLVTEGVHGCPCHCSWWKLWGCLRTHRPTRLRRQQKGISNRFKGVLKWHRFDLILFA